LYVYYCLVRQQRRHLYFNDALSAESFAMMKQAIDDETGAISVVTRAEVLAWPSHTAQSLQEATVGMAGFAQLGVDVAVADEAAHPQTD
jgi:hypothetical protein